MMILCALSQEGAVFKMGCGSDNTVKEAAPDAVVAPAEEQRMEPPAPEKPVPEIGAKPLQIAEKKDTQNTQKLTTEHMMLPSLTLSMHGGESLEVGQTFISDAEVLICAPEGHEIKIQATGEGKITISAFTPRVFPLTTLTDVIKQVSGENSVEMDVECQNISGFVVAVGSEGRAVELTLDGKGKPILSIMHVEPLP